MIVYRPLRFWGLEEGCMQQLRSRGMSNDWTAESIAQRAMDLGLINDWEMRRIWSELGRRNVPVEEFLQFLVRREYLTNYLIEKLLKGDRDGFFYGEYKVLYLVGAGSFARVFRAVNQTNNQVVALKVLRRRYSSNPECFRQFLREGQLGMALRHPNIVPVFDAAMANGSYYLVMEFVEGQNLREFLKIRKKLEPLEATRIMIDIISGLDYAFRQGLTHRDLKLSNVLISSEGTAKLVDFGLATVDEYLEAMVPEVPPNARAVDYAALEKLTGVSRNDPRSDIFFSGCMFYHLITGTAPLSETKDRLKRMNRNRFHEIPPIQSVDKSVPRLLTGIIHKAMSLDVTYRYQNPAHMLLDLKTAARKLAQGEADQELETLHNGAASNDSQPTVLVVESNYELQELFRNGLKKIGFRVLVVADPQRALERCHSEGSAPDCVLFSAADLGETALTCFNQLGDDPRTHLLPAILLLDEPQKHLAAIAVRNEHRRVFQMPLTMKTLRTEVLNLVQLQKDAAR